MTVTVSRTSHGRMRWPRQLLVLVGARAVNRLGAFAMGFLAVALVEEYGASLAAAGWVVAAFGFATIPSRLLGGFLADRLGRRRTIVLGLTGCSAGLGLVAAAPGMVLATLGATLLGLAFEIYEPPSQAMVAELVPAERRTQAFGLLGAALAVAGVGAGLLAVALGSVNLRLLFVADSVSCLAAAALVGLLVSDSRPKRAARASGSTPWRDVRLLTMLIAGTGFAAAYLTWVITLPLTLAARGHDAADTGWLLVLSAVVVVAAQRLLRYAVARPFAAMALGYLLLALGFAATAFVDTLFGFAAATMVVSVGEVALLGPPFAVVSGLAAAGSRGRYLAAYGTCWGIAQTLAPLGALRLFDVSPMVPWLAAAGLCFALAALQPLVRRLVLP